MENNQATVDETELVKGLVGKDHEALCTLLRTFGPKVKGWLQSRYGAVLQSAEVDEALSVVAFNAWRFADRFDPTKGPLSAWLIGIAGNAARSIIRGEQKHRSKHFEYSENYDPAWSTDVAVNDESVDCDDSSLERLEDLDRSIADLPPLQRAVIEADLASSSQTDDQRMAVIHGTTKNSIQVSRHKAIKNLRRSMNNLGYDSSGRKPNDKHE